MMRRGVAALYATLLIVAALLTSKSSAQGGLPLRTRLSMEASRVSIRSLLKASVEISNIDADHSYVVGLGNDDAEAFTLIVRMPDGVQETYHRRPAPGLHVSELHAPGSHTIPPGGTYTEELTLNDWYEFPAPGIYQLTLKMSAKATQEPSSGSATPEVLVLKASMSQTVTVSEPDEKDIQRQSQRLLNTIVSSSSTADVIRAADDLCAIHDPLTATYLVQAAEKRPVVAYRLISGLENLGTTGAVEGLLKLAQNSDTTTRALSVSALQRLQTTSQDSSIQDQVRSGLAAIRTH